MWHTATNQERSTTTAYTSGGFLFSHEILN